MKCSFWKWSSAAFLVLLLFSCSSKSEYDITIAVAASARFAAEDLVAQYEQEYGVQAALVVGSTGKLTAQIMAGAPYDLLLSADERYPRSLQESGKTTGDIYTIANCGLVLWTLDKDASLSLADLQPNEQVAIALPATAPFGALADSLLRLQPDYASNIQPRLVFGESIGQVNQFVTTGAVKYGLTAKSVVMSAALKNTGRWTDFGTATISQTVVIMKGRTAVAKPFVDFLLSESGQEILRKHGYEAVFR